MRVAILFLVFFCALIPACFAAPTFTFTADAATDFSSLPSAEQAFSGIADNFQPLWGFGWEIVMRRIGFGGTYMVDFFRDDTSRWAMDWYGEGLFVSYHIFGGGAFLDPFIQAGAGCAGRVLLHSTGALQRSPDISIFPFLAAGLSLNLEGFLLGAKLSYVPFQSEIPVTDIPGYPVENFKISIFAGISLGR